MRRSRPYQDLGLGGFCRQRARKNKASDAETFAFYRNCKKEGQRSQAERVRWRIIDSGVGGGGEVWECLRKSPCKLMVIASSFYPILSYERKALLSDSRGNLYHH